MIRLILSVSFILGLSSLGVASTSSLEAKLKALEAKVAKLEYKEGNIDINRVFKETTAGTEAQEHFRSYAASVQKSMLAEQETLKKKQEELMKLQANLEKQKNVKPDPLVSTDASKKKVAELEEKLKKAKAEFEQKARAFQMTQQQKQYEMQQKQAELMDSVVKEAKVVAVELAKKKGLNRVEVLDPSLKARVLYSTVTPVDLTNEVIVSLNSKADKKSAKG